jgi:transcriptional regulator with XRE-family HTH domain
MQQIDRENLQKLSKKIKELRLKQSKSLNQFVFANGYLTTATWSRLENGVNDYKFSTLLRVSRLLNVTIDELLKDIDFNYDFKED